jgi:hypothetical protein
MIKVVKKRLFPTRYKELARIIRRSASPTIAAIDAALAARDEAPAEAEPSLAVMTDGGVTIQLTKHTRPG